MMARMEMDWNLKQLGQLFRVLMQFLQKPPPKIYRFMLRDEILFDYLLHNSYRKIKCQSPSFFSQAPYYSPHRSRQKKQKTKQNKAKKQTKKIYFHFVVCWVHYQGERISGPSSPGLFFSPLTEHYPGNEVVPLRGNQFFQQVLLWLLHCFFFLMWENISYDKTSSLVIQELINMYFCGLPV